MAIPYWVGLGIDRREIAEALGTTVGSLEARCSQEGISLSGGVAPVVTLRRALRSDKWLRLRRAAMDRGVPVTQFVVELVDAVLGDDDAHSLLAAVLDDADED